VGGGRVGARTIGAVVGGSAAAEFEGGAAGGVGLPGAAGGAELQWSLSVQVSYSLKTDNPAKQQPHCADARCYDHCHRPAEAR